MRQTTKYSVSAPKAPVSDDAVGVPRWYVAIVNHNSEIKSAERLQALGYDVYVASQTQLRQRANGRKVKVNRLVIPSKIFIRCTEAERRKIVTLPYINRFMTNIAGSAAPGMHKPLVVIPPHEIYILRFMLGHTDRPVSITQGAFRKGERIRVVRGNLTGLTGEIYSDPSGTHQLTIALDILGYATVEIDPSDIEKE